MKRLDDGRHRDQHDSDRWQAVTERYLETQAQILREQAATHGAAPSPHLLAKAQVARIELEELKREIASRGAANPVS